MYCSVISGWKRWFIDTLEEAIPQFNSRAVLQLTEGAVTTMLPSVDRDLRGEQATRVEGISQLIVFKR